MMQVTRERHEQRKSKGQRERREKKIDKLAANSARGRSERTQSRLTTLNLRLQHEATAQLQEARENILVEEELHFKLNTAYVPRGKMILEIQDLAFSYLPNQKLIQDFNLTIYGPMRIALNGNNGSGKTTLIKLMLGELTPNSGNIHIGAKQIRYIDQQVALLDHTESILNNFLHFNPDLTEIQARLVLADFLFRRESVLKTINELSGGEKIRAALACILMAKTPPQLLILDEPTNHLDIQSVAHIESALKKYQGAMIVVSHDAKFLENIGIENTITLDKK